MKDKELSFWTTPPHCLLVISDEESSRILGSISMQKKSEEIAELNRLVVRPEARGLGLGTKLVHGLISEARKFGFKQVYLETTDAQKDARRLYQKIGFVKIGESGLVHLKNATFFKHFHGLYVCKYLYNIVPT
jgi:N-acetylglutamate synthase-like GNAT family acetyltransferase